jgi:hypothetical protein
MADSPSASQWQRPLLPSDVLRHSETHGGKNSQRRAHYYYFLLGIESFAFFLTFAAFNAAQTLNGSIRAPPGLAPMQFMAIYIVFALLCIPAPKLVDHIGPKACIALGMMPYVGLTISFLAPPPCGSATDGSCWSVDAIWSLRIATGVLLGCGAPILWTGQGVYLGRLAAHATEASADADAPLNAEPTEQRERLSRTLKQYNGFFFTSFQMSGAFGLVASSLVLKFAPGGTDAIQILFIGLSACCAAGLLCVIFLLPALEAPTSAAGA